MFLIGRILMLMILTLVFAALAWYKAGLSDPFSERWNAKNI